MNYNNFKFTLKNILGNKLYTFVSILSFATALSSAVFILLFLFNELSYDKHHHKYKRIYRLESDFSISERNQKVAKTSYAFGPAFLNEFPEVETFARFFQMNETVMRYGEKAFFEENILYADSSVFQIFDYHLISGNPATCLSNPSTIVLTKSFALKYFGNENPLGRTIEFQNGLKCLVTGVMEDLPHNSHVTFDALVSFHSQVQILGDEMYQALNYKHFWAIRLFTYILLREGTNMDNIHKNFGNFYQKYMDETGKRFNGSYHLLSHRLDQIHLNHELDWDYPTGSRRLLWVLGIIGMAILTLAAINYTNLATVRSDSLAKSIGLRKVFGVENKHLASHFIIESVLLTLMALAVALLICIVLLPVFNRITSTDFKLQPAENLPIYLMILGIAVITGVLSGIYPAFYLSSLKPVLVLKGKVQSTVKGGNFRKALIVFQFAVTVAMLIGIFTIYRQLRFMKNANPGFEPQNIFAIPMIDSAFNTKYFAFKNELLSQTGIESVSASSSVPGFVNYMDIMHFEGKEKMEEQVVNFYESDFHLISLMKFQLISGRDFDEKLSTEVQHSAIINKAMAEKFGWGNQAIGKKIERGFGNTQYYRVIGVVDNFNFNSLREEITPLVMFISSAPYGYLLVRMNENAEAAAIAATSKLWAEFCPTVPFDYIRLDETTLQNYDTEQNLLNIIICFSILSLFIALLGLLSFSMFITEKFTREIGIRKTFGASSANIFVMLMSKIAVLILIANVVAWPVAEILVSNWLDGFAYKVSLTWFTFALASLAALAIAMISVSIQTLRTATRRPIDILKYE